MGKLWVYHNDSALKVEHGMKHSDNRYFVHAEYIIFVFLLDMPEKQDWYRARKVS